MNKIKGHLTALQNQNTGNDVNAISHKLTLEVAFSGNL